MERNDGQKNQITWENQTIIVNIHVNMAIHGEWKM